MKAVEALPVILAEKYTKRTVIEEALRIFDEKLEEGDSHFAIVISAPTAYGKSSCTMAMAAALAERPGILGDRVVHVLPLRAIIEQLYREANKRMSHTLSVGAQAMLFFEADNTPFMFPQLVYTTIDSFIQNLFKAPVAEPYRDLSHFDVPRYSFYSSTVVFDEAHLYSSSTPTSNPGELRTGERRMFTAFFSALKALSEAGVPVVVMTATMPDGYFTKILNGIYGETFIVEYDPEEGSGVEHVRNNSIHRILVKDKDFRKFAIETNAKYCGLIDEEQLVVTVRRLLDEGKVLIVRNTVEKAIRTWERLKDDHAVLLHGRLTAGDRERRLSEVAETRLLISTQVIEAGVKLDFDALVSDAAPLSAIVQRVGRLRREGNANKSTPTLYLIEGRGDNVYHHVLVERTAERLETLRREEIQLGWRLPFRGRERVVQSLRIVGYKQLLEYVMNGWEYEVDQHLESVLSDIDTYFIVGTSDVRPVLRNICSFTRESGLLTLMHLPGNAEVASMELAYKYLMPMSMDALLYGENWKRVLDIDKGAMNVAGFDYKQKRVTVRHSKRLYNLFIEARKPCWLIDSVNMAMRELVARGEEERWMPIAIVINPDAYTEAGLLFP